MDDDLRQIRWFFISFAILILLIVGVAALVSRVFELAWFPWEVQTQVIRDSNSYITTQQTALRQLQANYEAATDSQKAAIVRQMNDIADLIPNDVQADVRSFLMRH